MSARGRPSLSCRFWRQAALEMGDEEEYYRIMVARSFARKDLASLSQTPNRAGKKTCLMVLPPRRGYSLRTSTMAPLNFDQELHEGIALPSIYSTRNVSTTLARRENYTPIAHLSPKRKLVRQPLRPSGTDNDEYGLFWGSQVKGGKGGGGVFPP